MIMNYSDILEVLKMTKAKEVLAEIERIYFEQRFDAGSMMGTLDAKEAAHAYKDLLDKLSSIPELNDEERSTLKGEIERRIADVDKVEEEKINNPELQATGRPYYLKNYLGKTKAEELQDTVEWVLRDYIDEPTSCSFNNLVDVKRAYEQLKGIFQDIPGITQEDINSALEKMKKTEKEIAKFEEEVDIN